MLPVLENNSDTSSRSLGSKDRLLHMLGKSQKAGLKPLFSHSHICPLCGSEHPAPALLDLYNSCTSCHARLRDPENLVKQHLGKVTVLDQKVQMKKRQHAFSKDARSSTCTALTVPNSKAWSYIPKSRLSEQLTIGRQPLEILFATYGDPVDPRFAVDVTAECRDKVQVYASNDRIAFRADVPIHEALNCIDPRPGLSKQLRIRYCMRGVYGTIILDTPSGRDAFPQSIVLITPRERHLKITQAYFGHPKGISSTGTMSYDVRQEIQGLADLMGGSYLFISHLMHLTSLFGDPCPGYTKDLRIGYEISGRSGRIVRDELHNHLKKRIYIEETPTVTPLILVESASYGITAAGRRDRIRKLEAMIFDIKALEYRMQQGAELSPQETALITNRKQAYLEELEKYRNMGPCFVDVTKKLQILADKGGISLKLEKNSFDPNALFGNPLKGMKWLEVSLLCHGHDSEKWTDTIETTSTGYPRNFITNKSASFTIEVQDDPTTGRGRMLESLSFNTGYAGPIIHIMRASYGNFKDGTKLMDCTSEIQARVQGPALCIEEKENLNEVCGGDPCPGQRKQLRIDYVTRGFSGNLRVREKNGLLVSSIGLGYTPSSQQDT